MNKVVFITGVDTNIGKTFVSIGLCLKEEYLGKKVGYYKPLQSGAVEIDERLTVPDVDEIKKYSSIETKYSYLFKGDVSPHLASIESDTDVEILKIERDLIEFSNKKDIIIIEGAGGLYCPAYNGVLFADLIAKLNFETIIVTTPDLGRLNHTLMTIECAKLKGIKIKGLIINSMPEEKTLSQENFIKELKMFSDIEILGVIPKMQKPTKEEIIKSFLNINL